MELLLKSVVFLACLPSVMCLTGHVCTVQKVRYQTFTTYRRVSRADRFKTNCGSFGWRSCTRYRHAYSQQTVQSVRTVYYTDNQCCPGWRTDASGSHCNIHDQKPAVTFCPSTITVQAVSESTEVSWQEPKFEEPHGFDLSVHAPYPNTTSSFPWGDTTVTYTATSANNNKQSSCTFVVRVLPTVDHPVVVGYASGESLNLEEDVPESLECRADHGRPPFTLHWLLAGQRLTQGVSSSTEPHGFEDLENAVSVLDYIPKRNHTGHNLTCQASKAGRETEEVYLQLDVHFDPEPILEYCPPDQAVQSQARLTELTRGEPVFSDVNEDPIEVFCNYRQKQTYTHGNHTVVCVGKNEITGKETVCSFVLSVSAIATCPLPPAPRNGAVLCGYWQDKQVLLCQYLCKSQNDVTFDLRVPELVSCTMDNSWFPRVDNFACSAKRGSVDYMPSKHNYLSGACTDPVVHELLKAGVETMVKTSFFKEVCTTSGCEPDEIEFSCDGEGVLSLS